MAVEGVRAARTGTDDKKGASPDTGAVVPLDRVIPPRRRAGRVSVREVEARRLVHPKAASIRDVDSFREIRTNLLMDLDVANPIILVTGVGRRCGASFVARNIALSIALQPDWDAVVIDCDPRPRRGGRIDRQDDEVPGVLDLLNAPTVRRDQVFRTSGVPGISLNGLPGFHLIPAGWPRPAATEQIASTGMGALLDQLRDGVSERCLVLDAPPARGASETRVLAQYAHRIVLVAGEGRHTPEAIAAAGQVFDPEKLAGLVYNRLP